MPQPLKILLQRCNELNKRDDMVRQFFRPSSAGSTRLPRHRFARDLDPADVAVKHEAKTKASEPSSSSRPSSALDRSKTQTPPSLDNPSISAAGASVGDAAVSEIITGQINWGTTVETTLAAITGGINNNEDALQRLLAAKRSALMQRIDPDGQFEADALQMQLQQSPLHHRALSPTKQRSSPAAQPSPLQRKFSIRPASAAATYGDENYAIGDSNAGLRPMHGADDHGTVLAPCALPSSQLHTSSSPAARRLERFAAVDAQVTSTIDQMHAHTHIAAAAPGEPLLRVTSPAPSRPSSAVGYSRAAVGNDEESGDRANRAEMYFLQVQVDNSSCGFSDRFDCVIMTHETDRRPLTASFPQLLMSKDRYLLFPGKPKMWHGLPTDKVFGSGVARMTDFDPRTVLSLSEYLPWISQPSQLLCKSFRVQVFCRVKRENARRCVVDKLITFNEDFTVDTHEFPESIKGLRDGQRATSISGKQRPQSAML